MESTSIQIESSNCNSPLNTQLKIAQQETFKDFYPNMTQITGNCSNQKQFDQQKISSKSSINTKIKYKKLLELYNSSLEKLHHIKADIQIIQNNKKNQKINNLSQQNLLNFENSQTKHRKGSQTSTAGQDQDIKLVICEKSFQQKTVPSQIIAALQKKLSNLRQQNAKKCQIEKEKIRELENELLTDRIKTAENNILSREKSEEKIKLKQQIQTYNSLQQKKQQLIQGNISIKNNIQSLKKQTQNLSNNIQYLQQTQNGCHQILDEQICSIKYKIQGKKIQYDSNKKYLDKIMRKYKYQQNISFEYIKNQINQLKQQCEYMMAKKNSQFNPDIKKYKQKRFQLVQNIQQVKKKIQQKENAKIQIEKIITEQNRVHQQLEDQYLAMYQKINQKIKDGHLVSYTLQQLKFFKQKKNNIKQEIKSINNLYQTQKAQIQNDQNLIPQSLIKQFQKKIKKKKQQLNQYEQLSKNNQILQKQNSKLNDAKQKMEWTPNHQIQNLNKQEKNLLTVQNSLNQTIKSLKKQNQIIQDKIVKVKQSFSKSSQIDQANTKQQKLKKQYEQEMQKQRLRKQEQDRIRQSRQKLIEKFRSVKQQTQCETVKKQQEVQKQQQARTKTRESKKNKHKKAKTGGSQRKQQLQTTKLDDSKLKSFFGVRENPLEMLKSDFPLNRSQEISQNISLLQSNPALYMFIIFVTVIIPGLCIGYNF